MTVGKIMIVMIFAALSFNTNAQKGVFASDSYNSVREYIKPLGLSQGQVVKWADLNKYYDEDVYSISNNQNYTERERSKKLKHLARTKDYDLQEILTARQYSRFNNINNGYYNSSNTYSRNRTYRGNSGYYGGYRSSRGYYGGYRSNRGYYGRSRGYYGRSRGYSGRSRGYSGRSRGYSGHSRGYGGHRRG